MASVTAGNEPAIATNTTARSVTPNQITARGTQATNGVIWSATTSGRMLRRASSNADRTKPEAVPITSAAANENASRIRVFTVASTKTPSAKPSRNAVHTSAGPGIEAVSVAAATIAQTTTSTTTTEERRPQLARPSLHGAPSSSWPIRRSWISDTTRAIRTSSSFRGRWASIRNSSRSRAGCRRHHEHAVGEEHRLANVVGGEQERGAAGALDALALHDVLEPLAGERVERAERLVAQQDRRVARERACEGGALTHACRQLVWLPARGPSDADPGQPSRGPLVALLRWDVREPEREVHVPSHREPGEQRGLLEEHGAIGTRTR